MNIVTGTLLLATICSTCRAADIKDVSWSIDPKGVVIQSVQMGRSFSVPPPVLIFSDGASEETPDFASDGTSGMGRYACGAKVVIESKPNGVRYTLTKTPANAACVRFSMHIPGDVNQGWKYAFGGKYPQDIPAEMDKQFVAGGSEGADQFTLVDAEDNGIILAIDPAPTWAGLQDNRVFNLESYVYSALCAVDTASVAGTEISIQITPMEPTAP